MIGEECHKVEIIYEPEKDGDMSEIEILKFSDEKTARAVAERQRKIPNVRDAQYKGE